ncbi:excinuclease ABC subunit A [Vibrio sp. JCM 19236]|nr:excinuclease ABC subunit A [Vibrio sp. JCM 19236]
MGVQQYFDEGRVVLDDSLSIADGAIKGWDQKNYYYFQMLGALAEHYDFDLYAPFNSLPKKIREIVLTGSGRTQIEFKYINDRGDIRVKTHPFEGILNTLERRYRDTESNSVREDLAKYISTRSCSSCGGTRLREEARNVFIADTPLPNIVEMSISDAMQFFKSLELEGRRRRLQKR